MCRFVAFLGKEPAVLHEILGKHENSLINQSRCSVETKMHVNGDGFGIGWYDLSIQEHPALFKSIQPAWNDQNLKNMTTIVKSTCFLGHVRASTVGEVNLANCHPFVFGKYLFVHNGTIEEFDKIKRPLISSLSEASYQSIKGQTDSEHLFALIFERLVSHPHSLEQMLLATREALNTLEQLQRSYCNKVSYRINIALTDGERLLVLKTQTPDHKTPLSLYFHANSTKENHPDFAFQAPYALICSEKLWGVKKGKESESSWIEIPSNHFYIVDQNFSGQLIPLE